MEVRADKKVDDPQNPILSVDGGSVGERDLIIESGHQDFVIESRLSGSPE